MSNLRDGGSIVIGVEDLSFTRQGVTEEIKRSYNIDIMRDQMGEWADPHVEFSTSCVTRRTGHSECGHPRAVFSTDSGHLPKGWCRHISGDGLLPR